MASRPLGPFDLELQAISEALLAVFGTLGSTFGPSKTIPGRQKIESKKNQTLIRESLFCVLSENGVYMPPRTFLAKP